MNIYRSTFLLAVSLLFLPSSLFPQGSAGTDASIESRYLIDLPTAGIIPKGAIALDADFYHSDGFLTGASIGLFNRIFVGVSYGGTNIVGSGSPDWNNIPGFQLRLRVIDESVAFPAIALGFDSQGKDGYIESENRYTIKSMGLYAVGSKNYSWLGFLAVHAGLNYSFERADGDDDLNAFAGVEKTVGPFLSFLGEYNLGSNDSNGDALGNGRGYLNLGLRISVGNGFSLSFAVKDLLRNQNSDSVGNRVIQFEYVHLD